MELQTDYLSAEKASVVEVGRELVHVATNDVAREITYLRDSALVLNASRQIVFANEPFMDLVGLFSLVSVIGRRLGEVLMCHHASENAGCGTTKHCRGCAIAQALEKCKNGGGLQRGVCLLSSDCLDIDHVPINFTIAPLVIAEANYFVVSFVLDSGVSTIN